VFSFSSFVWAEESLERVSLFEWRGAGTAMGVGCASPLVLCLCRAPVALSEVPEACPRDPDEGLRMGEGLN